MFAIQFLWWEPDVKIYLKRLCLNDATITYFLAQCRRHFNLTDTMAHEDRYEQAEVIAIH